jgi:hypothetical protein
MAYNDVSSALAKKRGVGESPRAPNSWELTDELNGLIQIVRRLIS